MRSLLGTMIVAGFAMGLSAVSAHADSTVACPLFQATRTIVEPLPPGWTTNSQVSPLTDYKVDNSSGQERLVCTYGASGSVARAAPVNEDCTKIPGKRFKCVSAPPPGPIVSIVSDGPITLVDNGVADLDAGGAPDIRLRADNPFLRLLEPVNNTRLSPQGTHLPTFADCQTAPYGAARFRSRNCRSACGCASRQRRQLRPRSHRQRQRHPRPADSDDDLPRPYDVGRDGRRRRQQPAGPLRRYDRGPADLHARSRRGQRSRRPCSRSAVPGGDSRRSCFSSRQTARSSPSATVRPRLRRLLVGGLQSGRGADRRVPVGSYICAATNRAASASSRSPAPVAQRRS